MRLFLDLWSEVLLWLSFFCISWERRVASPLRCAVLALGTNALISLLYLWERQHSRMKGPISLADQRGCPGPRVNSRRCHRYVLFCTMSYLLIYSTPPPPTHRSLLIWPIKINLQLKIPTLAHRRGCNRGDGGVGARPIRRSRWQVCLTKVPLASTSGPGRLKERNTVFVCLSLHVCLSDDHAGRPAPAKPSERVRRDAFGQEDISKTHREAKPQKWRQASASAGWG